MTGSRKRVLLAASGGGHITELLRVAAAFDQHEVAFASVRDEYAQPDKAYYKLQEVTRWEPRTIPSALSVARSALRDFRPHCVVSTGALPGLLTLLAARSHAQTLHLDSFANAETLSGSGKIARRFATETLTQWPKLASGHDVLYRGKVFSIADPPAPTFVHALPPRIFVSVGAQIPFDRFTRAVAAFARKKPAWQFVFQVGAGGYRPDIANADVFELLKPRQFQHEIERATVVVSHAGTGNILAALQAQKPIVIFPRLASLRETRNEHQSATAHAFRGCTQVATHEHELATCLEQAETLTPRAVLGAPDASLLEHLRAFVDASPQLRSW